MTRKKAKKVLMEAGYDRNAAEFFLRDMKRRGCRENLAALNGGLYALIAVYETEAERLGCEPEEVRLGTVHVKGNGLIVRICRANG